MIGMPSDGAASVETSAQHIRTHATTAAAWPPVWPEVTGNGGVKRERRNLREPC